MTDSFIEVPSKLFLPAEAQQFSGSFTYETLEAGPDTYTFQGPLSWVVTVQNTGDALLVSGSAQAQAQTQCARCLEDFALDLQGEIEGYYLLSEESVAPSDMDDDEFEVLPEDHKIDMVPLVLAALLIELPLVPLCSQDCKGLCAQCGANLNEGPCACSEENEADDIPRMSDGRVSPFAVLKDLDLS